MVILVRRDFFQFRLVEIGRLLDRDLLREVVVFVGRHFFQLALVKSGGTLDGPFLLQNRLFFCLNFFQLVMVEMRRFLKFEQIVGLINPETKKFQSYRYRNPDRLTKSLLCLGWLQLTLIEIGCRLHFKF